VFTTGPLQSMQPYNLKLGASQTGSPRALSAAARSGLT